MSISPSLDLMVHREHPFNAEPRADRLPASFFTQAANFYVRCHGAVPTVEPESFRLSVEGNVAKPLDLSLDDLRSSFERVAVAATLQCAGNRRADLDAVAPVAGDLWRQGAIGTAEWTGVRLIDILIEAGIDEESARHIAFEGLDVVDTDEGAAPYGASIPIDKATGEDVILAMEMNGHALLPAHGAPLRVVVPGYAGVRSVKWVKRIRVQAEPSQHFHQRNEYKLFPATLNAETADPAEGMTINEMPLNSAICEPAEGAALSAGRTRVSGYAIAGERQVARVEVSVDGGRSFRCATLEERDASAFTWTLWHIKVDLPAGPSTLVVRAVDSAGQSQPADARDVWNFKGYLGAAWHRIAVTAEA